MATAILMYCRPASVTIALYRNNGSNNPTFTAMPAITTSADGAFSVFAIDLNGDGQPDVLSASSDDDTVSWYNNSGGSIPTFTAMSPISTSVGRAWSVIATDLNGDSYPDVLSASWDDTGTMTRLPGTSNPTFSTMLTITTSALGTFCVFH
eukprot:m.294550 g.294550  ORF g.294550 m.294550 type:complete len:151 (+) comp22965_c4_seq3:174-626(+)